MNHCTTTKQNEIYLETYDHHIHSKKPRLGTSMKDAFSSSSETGCNSNEVSIDYNALSRHLATLDVAVKYQRVESHPSVNLFNILVCEANERDKLSNSSENPAHDHESWMNKRSASNNTTRHGCAETHDMNQPIWWSAGPEKHPHLLEFRFSDDCEHLFGDGDFMVIPEDF